VARMLRIHAMNWEALRVIGALIAVLALVLFPLGLWLGRRAARAQAKEGHSLTITRIGFVYFGVFVALLLLGLAIPAISKGTWLGRAMGASGAMMLYYGLLVASCLVLERFFKRRGIQIVRHQTGRGRLTMRTSGP
jgi:flagellar biogenesis protein FliO